MEQKDIMTVLEQSRSAAQRINECMARLGHVTSQSFGSMSFGNPSEQADAWIKAFDEIERSSELTRDAARLISGIALSLGSKYAMPLYSYYVRATPTWKAVAKELDITERTALTRKSVAIEWAESVGYTMACNGVDTLELGELPDYD